MGCDGNSLFSLGSQMSRLVTTLSSAFHARTSVKRSWDLTQLLRESFFASAFITTMTCWIFFSYISITVCLFNFIVGVSSPPGSEKSFGAIMNLCTWKRSWDYHIQGLFKPSERWKSLSDWLSGSEPWSPASPTQYFWSTTSKYFQLPLCLDVSNC